MAKENETIADIVAEMRGDGHTGPADALEWVRIKLEYYADRLEAAHKREAAFHAMTCEANDRLREHLQIALDADKRERISPDGEAGAAKRSLEGCDCAKLREALKNVAKQLTDATEDENFGEDVMYLVGCMRTMSRKCRAALAAPPRNCDVGTAEEQEDRFRRYCNSRGTFCGDCPLYNNRRGECRFAWAQMPYVEKEGGAK